MFIMKIYIKCCLLTLNHYIKTIKEVVIMLSGGIWFAIVVYVALILACIMRMYKFYREPEILKDNDEYERG